MIVFVSQIRPLWRHYYGGSDAIIFVVDSADTERMNQCTSDGESKTAMEEIHYLMQQPELEGIPLLILCNKQDLPQSVSVQQATDMLQLHKIRNHPW